MFHILYLSTQNIKFYWFVMKIEKFMLPIWWYNRGLCPLWNKYYGVFVLNGINDHYCNCRPTHYFSCVVVLCAGWYTVSSLRTMRARWRMQASRTRTPSPSSTHAIPWTRGGEKRTRTSTRRRGDRRLTSDLWPLMAVYQQTFICAMDKQETYMYMCGTTHSFCPFDLNFDLTPWRAPYQQVFCAMNRKETYSTMHI